MRFIKFGYSHIAIDIIHSVTFDPKETSHEAYVIRLRLKGEPMTQEEYFYFNRSAAAEETQQRLQEEAYKRFYEILELLNKCK